MSALGERTKLQKYVEVVEKHVEALKSPGEKWSVTSSDRGVSVTLWNPRNLDSGRGQSLASTKSDHIKQVMKQLRSDWREQHEKDDDALQKFLDESPPPGDPC